VLWNYEADRSFSHSPLGNFVFKYVNAIGFYVLINNEADRTP